MSKQRPKNRTLKRSGSVFSSTLPAPVSNHEDYDEVDSENIYGQSMYMGLFLYVNQLNMNAIHYK